jgi:hypothetical protein
MAYTIDFTAHVHARRRKGGLLLAVCYALAAAGMVYGVRWTKREWLRETLAERLKRAHDLATVVENLHHHWNRSAMLFENADPWYSLYWSESVTNALPVLLDTAGQLAATSGLEPRRWTLKTGGECELNWLLRMRPDEPRARRQQLATVCQQLTERLARWDPEVNAEDQQVAVADEIPIKVRFALRSPRFRRFPPEPVALKDAVARLDRQRKMLRAATLDTRKRGQGLARTVNTMLQEALTVALPLLQQQAAGTQTRDWRAYAAGALDPGTLLYELEAAVIAAGHPVPSALAKARMEWASLAARRWPWHRRRDLEDSGRLTDDMHALQALIHAGLPPMSIFSAQLAQLHAQREALMSGPTARDVFGDLAAERCLAGIWADWPSQAWRASVTRQPVRDGLMFATWVVEMKSMTHAAGKDYSQCLHEVAARFSSITALQYGFEIEKLQFEIMVDTRGLRTTEAIMSGLLAVVAEE